MCLQQILRADIFVRTTSWVSQPESDLRTWSQVIRLVYAVDRQFYRVIDQIRPLKEVSLAFNFPGDSQKTPDDWLFARAESLYQFGEGLGCRRFG